MSGGRKDKGNKAASAGNSAGNGEEGSAADIARRIQRMTLLVRGAARSLQPLRPSPGNGATAGETLEPGQEALRRKYAQQDASPRRYGRQNTAKSSQSQETGQGWWVLAQGRELDPEDFEARELARGELLDTVRRTGVLVPENIWVWDETGRAQLVLATLPTEERALRLAEHLRGKGLVVIVRREMP